MKYILSSLIFIMMSGCVAISPTLESQEDIVTGQIYYTFGLVASYPKKKFMTPTEWDAYHKAPDSQKEALYRSYKEREEIEENWENFIEDCILLFTLDC
jgi:hypothetical protein